MVVHARHITYAQYVTTLANRYAVEESCSRSRDGRLGFGGQGPPAHEAGARAASASRRLLPLARVERLRGRMQPGGQLPDWLGQVDALRELGGEVGDAAGPAVRELRGMGAHTSGAHTL